VIQAPLSLRPVRRGLRLDGLSGVSHRRHVALTYDDGPDRASTPAFLDLLERLGVRATFFVLGAHVRDHGLLAAIDAAGHELAVHGWDHRPVALHRPRELRDGLARTRDLVSDVTGGPVRWYRPPYGFVTARARRAATSLGLTTVLWSAWGRDWSRAATPASVTRLVTAQLRPGGTVLLHDSDRTSAPGSWRTTLAATERLVPAWRADGLEVGPLAEHW
jgi:peptidoglycan-N-acetylglucosamine deacetylase